MRRGGFDLPLASYLDLTLLRPEATPGEVEALCATARRTGAAGVCVLPCHLPLVAERLAGSPVRPVTVANFPYGISPWAAEEVARALAGGAAEVDAVLPLARLVAGDTDGVLAELAAWLQACGDRAALKVIIEVGRLNAAERDLAVDLCRDAGVEWVKTSTGVAVRPTSVDDVRAIALRYPRARIKAAGGVRTPEQARELIAAGAQRIGTSAASLAEQ